MAGQAPRTPADPRGACPNARGPLREPDHLLNFKLLRQAVAASGRLERPNSSLPATGGRIEMNEAAFSHEGKALDGTLYEAMLPEAHGGWDDRRGRLGQVPEEGLDRHTGDPRGVSPAGG